MPYGGLLGATKQKPIVDTQKTKTKAVKHTTTEKHHTTQRENMRRNEQTSSKTRKQGAKWH